MESQDYLMKQIALLGMVLSRILSDLFSLKNTEDEHALTEIVQRELRTSARLELSELINGSAEEFLSQLQLREDFDLTNLEKLADILYFYAQNLHEGNPRPLLHKCLTLYRHLDKVSQTYVPARLQKMNEIEHRLVE